MAREAWTLERLAEAWVGLGVAGRCNTRKRGGERERHGQNEDDAGDETKRHVVGLHPTGEFAEPPMPLSAARRER